MRRQIWRIMVAEVEVEEVVEEPRLGWGMNRAENRQREDLS